MNELTMQPVRDGARQAIPGISTTELDIMQAAAARLLGSKGIASVTGDMRAPGLQRPDVDELGHHSVPPGPNSSEEKAGQGTADCARHRGARSHRHCFAAELTGALAHR